MADMVKRGDPSQVHSYTNPSFCLQSEYVPEDSNSDSSELPPPPQFQVDDLPPPPATVHQPPPQYGQTNPAFHGSPETDLNLHRSVVNLNHTTVDRYCYIDDSIEQPASHKRYGSLPLGSRHYRNHRYEYIQDDAAQVVQQQQQQIAAVAAANASRYEYIEQQKIQQQRSTPQQQQVVQPIVRRASVRASVRSYRTADAHYASLGPDGVDAGDMLCSDEGRQGWNTSVRQISTPRGRYTSVPMQDEEPPPSLPDRNELPPPQQQQQLLQQQQFQQQQQRLNNVATQKLHEILTTPRKPRSRSQDPLSPIKSPQQQPMLHNVARNAFTPGCSPSSTAAQRMMSSPAHGGSTPHLNRGSVRKGPTTSTPNKELPAPSARRCLPLNESVGPVVMSSTPPQPTMMVRRHLEDSQTYGRAGSQRVTSPQRYAVPEQIYIDQQKKEAQANGGFYQSVENAFIARTAVVPPLSPPMSDANTTLVSGTEKSDRKNAPLILVLVGILTCGLAIYLSYTQGRRYYFDSAISCGACCALAGACRSMRRTWTGLGLAGLSALSCAGLLLLAAKSPRPGTPMHDVTAGALCGVSILGAALALLALLAPKCSFGRHRRVHSWIPRFSP